MTMGERPLSHAQDLHTHGQGCGHMPVFHRDHVDFVVDGKVAPVVDAPRADLFQLHRPMPDGSCRAHGFVPGSSA